MSENRIAVIIMMIIIPHTNCKISAAPSQQENGTMTNSRLRILNTRLNIEITRVLEDRHRLWIHHVQTPDAALCRIGSRRWRRSSWKTCWKGRQGEQKEGKKDRE